jgi:hypothetical protein
VIAAAATSSGRDSEIARRAGRVVSARFAGGARGSTARLESTVPKEQSTAAQRAREAARLEPGVHVETNRP